MRHVLEPHCADPGCCVGVIVGRCTTCGFVVSKDSSCPTTKNDFPPLALGEKLTIVVNFTGHEVITA